MLDSKANPGKKVPDGNLTEGLAYHAFVMEKALEHPGPVEQTVDWLLTRDHQTRTKACSLCQDNWPWGEALRVARETHLAVLWTCGNVGVSSQEPQSSAVISSDIANQPPAKNASSGSNTFKPPQQPPFRFDQLCKDFNTHGCSNKQRDCPHKKKHACSQYVGKELCLAWQHGHSDSSEHTDIISRLDDLLLYNMFIRFPFISVVACSLVVESFGILYLLRKISAKTLTITACLPQGKREQRNDTF